MGADLTVIATMAAKCLNPALAGSRARNTKPSPFAATSKAETGQHSKYDGPVRLGVASMNPPLKFVAIADLPGLVTTSSAVHNPRTLAATSDPDTHGPMAATPAGGP